MNQRITAIANAATRLFLQQGYAKTQINHIAKEIGVSVGTIYLNFTGKKEILHYILMCTIRPEFANQELERPVTDDIFDGLDDQIMNMLKQSSSEFASHLTSIDEYSFEEMISDAFDMLSRYAAGCLFIEKNQYDFKKLANHYKTYRKQFFDTMTQYLAKFIEAGTVRPLEHVDLTTTLIIEVLSWWSMDIHYTSFETQTISNELAKKICMDNILSAYRS